jgi:hypothetical protein
VGCRTDVGLEILEKDRRGQSSISGELTDGTIELVVSRRSNTMIAFDIHDAAQDTEKDR